MQRSGVRAVLVDICAALITPCFQVCDQQVTRRVAVLPGVRGYWRDFAVPGAFAGWALTHFVGSDNNAQVDLREFDADSDGVDGGEFYSDSD